VCAATRSCEKTGKSRSIRTTGVTTDAFQCAIDQTDRGSSPRTDHDPQY
jgi:hypothetical protein